MKLIRDARLAEGLTQAQLARRLGITQPSVARLEAAGEEVSVATLQRALNAMGRRLELQVVAMPSSVDEGQVRELLRLTPGQRLELHDASYEGLRQWANEAQAAIARVA
jgi:transcriptional regulator with XRE-family HTH domain